MPRHSRLSPRGTPDAACAGWHARFIAAGVLQWCRDPSGLGITIVTALFPRSECHAPCPRSLHRVEGGLDVQLVAFKSVALPGKATPASDRTSGPPGCGRPLATVEEMGVDHGRVDVRVAEGP